MKVLRLFPLVLALAACSSVNVPLSPYRIDVQQGNALEQESVEKLKLGLTRSQVRFLLGTPLVVDPFHANRWDYVYNHRKGGKLTEERRLVLFFDGDVLVRIEAEGFPARGDVPEARSGAAKPPEKAAEPAPATAPPVQTAKPVEPAPASAAAVAAEKPAAPAPQPRVEAAPAVQPKTEPTPAVQPAAAANLPRKATEPAAQPASSAGRSLDDTSIVQPLDSAQAQAPRKPAAAGATPPEAVALQVEDNAAALKPFVMPEFPNAATPGTSEEQIAAALNAWAGAWRARDEDAYLSAYAANFRPEGGQSRAEWEKRRRLLLGVSRNIDIKIEGVATEIVSENQAIVSFKQLYRSDTHQDSVIKQMKFVRVDNLWLIEEEKVLAPVRVKK